MIIYPVIEFADLVYAHEYGWLDALAETTEGVLLRPESKLRRIYKSGLTIREYLARKYGIVLRDLKIMMDHGINTNNFREVFGLSKTPRNVVQVYNRLGVDLGVAFDVPARLYEQAIIDVAVDGYTNIDVDSEVKDVVVNMAKAIREQVLKPSRETARRLLRDHESELRKLSRLSAEVTLRRLGEMLQYADEIGFSGLVPVIQGMFKDDIEYSVRGTIELVAQYRNTALIAIGTGGRVLSSSDVDNIAYAISKIKEYSSKYGLSVRIHLLGASSPDVLPQHIVKDIYSADSLTPRKRAAEGRIYLLKNGKLELVHVSRVRDHSCNCPACRRMELRKYVLDGSGKRKNDVRLVHNTFILMNYLNKTQNEDLTRWLTGW
jgi:queuine/archaeosine tRNA-ribosyltransferase